MQSNTTCKTLELQSKPNNLKSHTLPKHGLFKDLTGKKFDRILVVEYLGKKANSQHYWLCQCDCGNETRVTTGNLNFGTTKSCGCLKIEKCTTHGRSYEPWYDVYRKMIDRCTNPDSPRYSDYGGRGIKVCDEWLEDLNQFNVDMGERPEGLTLDRINNNGNYEPSNCRWATAKQQAQNRRTRKKVKK